MKFLRRILGIFVMIAGIIGLLLSLSGLVGLWMVRPLVKTSLDATISTLTSSIDTSQKAMTATIEALNAGITSVDALSEMLDATALTVEDTQPVITQMNAVMGETLPNTLKSATSSLEAAQQAAVSLEGAIQSFETFKVIIGSVLPISSSTSSYAPKIPLADSLGALVTDIEEMPATFEGVSANIEKADDNLETIKTNLSTMSDNVALISGSLSEYQGMVGESQTSMSNLKTMLTGLQEKLDRIVNLSALVLGLFLLWLLAAQVVIFSQGWELYHGTAGRMDRAQPQPVAVEAAVETPKAE